MNEITPEMVAVMDQQLTDAKTRMNGLLVKLREQAEKDGEPQAIANLALAVTDMLPVSVLMEMLVVAFHELAFGSETPVFADSEKTEQE